MPSNPNRAKLIWPPPLWPPEPAAAAVAVTVTDCASLPPPPVQVRLYIVVAATTTDALPLVARLPVNVPPLAVHEVALVLVQVSVVAAPAATVVGDAVKVTVGAELTICMPYIPYCGWAPVAAVPGVATKFN